MEKFEEIIELEDEMVQHRDCDKFFHKKIYSDDEVYIYQVNNNWFEVFRRNVVPKAKYENGQFIKVDGLGRARYPKDDDFGKWAWNCVDEKTIKNILVEKFKWDENKINAVFAHLKGLQVL